MEVALRNGRDNRDGNTGFHDVPHTPLSRAKRTGMIAKAIVEFGFAIDTYVYLGIRVLQEGNVMLLDQGTVCTNCNFKPAHPLSRLQNFLEVGVKKRLAARKVERANTQMFTFGDSVKHRLQRQLLTARGRTSHVTVKTRQIAAAEK